MDSLADCMLGKLARWLRILEYDTVYDNFAADDNLLQKSAAEKRILLTRDGPLADRAAALNLPHVFVNENGLEEQLAQLVVDVSLDVSRITFTRCLECNKSMIEVPATAVADRMPPYVIQTQTTFFRCSVCNRVYWAGSHTTRMNERLASIRRIASKRQEDQRA